MIIMFIFSGCSRPLNIADHSIDREDLKMVDISSRWGDAVLRTLMIKPDGIRLMGEEINDRCGEKDKILLSHSGRREGELVEFKREFKDVAFAALRPFFPAGNIEKEKVIRQVEIFLQQSVAGKGVAGIRN